MTTANPTIDTVVATLIQQWLWDIQQLSQPWLYWWFCVPALFFAVFVLLKWAVITSPIWLPLALIVKVLRFYKV